MNKTEVLYSIGSADATTNEFDLQDLGDRHYVHMATVGSYKGRTQQTFGYDADVKLEDYDKKFLKKLCNLRPPQRVRDLLEHHWAYFVGTGGDPIKFLDHFRYNVLHQLEERYSTLPNTAVARDWFNKNMDKINKRNKGDRASSTTINNNITASNSNVHVANNSPHTKQTTKQVDRIAETKAFTDRVTAKLDEIEQLITAEQFVSLKTDLEYLKEKLDEPNPRFQIVDALLQGLLGSLPTELLGALAGSLIG